MPIPMIIAEVDGDVTGPSLSEVVITKSIDCASEPLFKEDTSADFAFDDSLTSGERSGVVNVAFADGSVRSVSSSIGAATGDGAEFKPLFAFSDFDLA